MCDNSIDFKNILEINSKKSKELKSSFQDEFNVYNSKMMQEAKKESGEHFDENEQLEINRQKFGMEFSKKLYKINFGVFDDFTDKLEAAFQATLENLPMVGPFFSVFFSVFGGGGVDLKAFYNQIIDAVEKMIEQAMAEQVKRQCQMHFENLQSACKTHQEYTQMWYDTHGVKSFSYDGKEMKSTLTDDSKQLKDQLENLILASFNDIRIKFSDSLTYFSESGYFGYTIPHYMVTSALYLTFLEDTIKWGKQMNFPPELIDGTTNVPSLSSVRSSFIEKSIKTMNIGVMAYFKICDDYSSTSWPFYTPVALNIGLGITFKRFWPNSHFSVRRDYLLKSTHKGVHTIYTGDFNSANGWYGSSFPSFYTGTFSLMPSVTIAKNMNFNVINENNVNRTISIKIHHIINRVGDWRLNLFNSNAGEPGSVTKNFSLKTLDATHDACQNAIPILGWSNLGTYTTNHKYIQFICLRNYSSGSYHGYAKGSQIFDIEIIDQ